MAYCSNCGSEIIENAKFCANCGEPVALVEAAESVEVVESTSESTPPAPTTAPVIPVAQTASATPNATAPSPAAAPSPQAPASSGKAIAALVLGILAIVASETVVFGLIFGILAIIFGGSALKVGYDRKAKAGRICGIIGTVCSALSLVSYLALGVFVGLMTTGHIVSNDEAVEAIEEIIDENVTVKDGVISISTGSSDSSGSSSSSGQAQGSSQSPIVGTWEGNLQSGEVSFYEFRANGAFLQYVDNDIYEAGSYTLKGDVLSLDGDFEGEEEWRVTFKDDGNTMLMTWPLIDDITFTYHRV